MTDSADDSARQWRWDPVDKVIVSPDGRVRVTHLDLLQMIWLDFDGVEPEWKQ